MLTTLIHDALVKKSNKGTKGKSVAIRKRIREVRRAIAAYVDAEIARCGNPPDPAMVHSDVARVLLYCQVEAQNKIDAWVDAEIGKRKKEDK